MLSSLFKRLKLPFADRTFVVLALVAIVVVRVGLIVATPKFGTLDDPQIYRGVGIAVLAGVNPYDFNDKVDKREALRQQAHQAEPSADMGHSLEKWNYYVSSNFPASTALYAAIQALSGGSIVVLRLIFILGDICILLGLVALVKAVRVNLADPYLQVGITAICVFYPALLIEGTVIPEDKQFQTALMLWAAALLLKARSTVFNGLLTGFVLALSVLFKLFGIFLFPLWCVRAWRGWPGFVTWTALGAAVPTAASFAAFGLYFVQTMASRGKSESGNVAAYASPWVLFPSMGNHLVTAKLVIVAVFAGGLLFLLVRKRIDLLNFCAGSCVAFVTIWLSTGAFNRVNVGLMFGICCLVTLSERRFFWTSIYAAVTSGLIYAVGLKILKVGWSALEPTLAFTILLGYVAALVTVPGRVTHASPTTAPAAAP